MQFSQSIFHNKRYFHMQVTDSTQKISKMCNTYTKMKYWSTICKAKIKKKVIALQAFFLYYCNIYELNELCWCVSSDLLDEKTVCQKFHICNICVLYEFHLCIDLCVFSNLLLFTCHICDLFDNYEVWTALMCLFKFPAVENAFSQ